MMGVLQMYLDLFREGCTEHHRVSDAFMRHGILFDNASYLRFKSHVQHTVCLVQDQVADKDTKDEEDVISPLVTNTYKMVLLKKKRKRKTN